MDEIERLVDEGLINEAVQKARQLSCAPPELWKIVHKQISNRRYDRASRLIEDLQLGVNDPQSISDFVLRALVDAQFSVAIKWSLALKGQRPNPQDCVAVAIQRDCVELALKYIAELNLEGFDVLKLIERLCNQENLTAARKYAQRFALEAQFPPEALVERMFHVGQWDNALTLINQVPKLKSSFSGLTFLERIVRSRDWVSSIKFAQQFGIPLKSSMAEPLNPSQKSIVRMMIEGMIRDGKLYQAMRLVVSHNFQDEFPPKQLIQTMIMERQYSHALRFIRALQMTEEFREDLGKIHKERMRDLVEFRKLMALRKKNCKLMAPSARDAKVVVAQLFLGARTFVRRPDGKLVLTNPTSGAGTLQIDVSGALENAPIKQQQVANEEDEEEEEIVFAKKPVAALSARQPNVQKSLQQPQPPQSMPSRSMPNQHGFTGAQGPFLPQGHGFIPPLHMHMQARPTLIPMPGSFPLAAQSSLILPHGAPPPNLPFPIPPSFQPGVPLPMPGNEAHTLPAHLIQRPGTQFAAVQQQQLAQQHHQQIVQKHQESALAADGKKGSQQPRKVLMPSQLF